VSKAYGEWNNGYYENVTTFCWCYDGAIINLKIMKQEENDSQWLQLWMFGPTLNLICEALYRYKKLVQPRAVKGNNRINDEVQGINNLLQLLNSREIEARGDILTISLGNLRYIKGVVELYRDAFARELEEKKGYSTIIGEFEADEEKLNVLNELLLKGEWGKHKSRVDELLIGDFYIKSEGLPSTTLHQIQYNIGPLVGQFIADNHGNINQSINLQIIDQLNELSDVTSTSRDLDKNEKEEIRSLIQVLQSQTMKLKPQEGIIERAFDAINKVIIAKEGTAFANDSIRFLVNIAKLLRKFPGVDHINLPNA